MPLTTTLPRVLALSLGLALAGQAARASAPQSPALQRLATELAAHHREALPSFWATLPGGRAPLTEDLPGEPDQVLVTYLFRHQPGVASVALQTAYGYGNKELRRMDGTDLWFASETRPKGYQGFYSFKLGREGQAQPDFIADPLNPMAMKAPVPAQRPASLKDDFEQLAACSLLLTPGVAAPDCLDPKPGVPAGRVEEFTVPSRIYPGGRRIWIYLPPGFEAMAPEACGALLCFDGAAYLTTTPLPTILDNLLAEQRIRPMVAVLVDNGGGAKRLEDLANHRKFADFVAGELMPWVRQRWHFSSDPHRALITGFSAGGLGAVYVAALHPELFGNVFSQSGAIWRGNEGSSTSFEYMKELFASTPRRDIRFAFEVGSRETSRPLGTGPIYLEASRRLRDTLLAKGYEVDYREVPEAVHEPVHWRNSFPSGLLQLAAPARRDANARLAQAGR